MAAAAWQCRRRAVVAPTEVKTVAAATDASAAAILAAFFTADFS